MFGHEFRHYNYKECPVIFHENLCNFRLISDQLPT